MNKEDIRHDIESYVITIRRKGQVYSQPVQTAPATAARYAVMEHEEVLNEPQEAYGTSVLSVTAPLPGIIIGICVKPGDQVREGQELAVLEAMKMENSIEAPKAGTIRKIHVSTGDTVSEGTAIMDIE